MTPQDWNVAAVTTAREWQGKHGSFIDYRLELHGYPEAVWLTQKPETSEPTPGDDIYGHIETQEMNGAEGPWTKHKLKKDRREDGTGPPARPQASGGNAVGRTASTPPQGPAGGGDFDGKSERIERQSIQKAVGGLLSGTNPSKETVTEWLDYLSADLDSYEKARRGQLSAPIPVEPTLEDAVLAEDNDPERIPF